METSYSSYDFEKSIERIDEVINGSDASYEDKNSIPSRDCLTFSNGFYVDCAAVFIDIRGSKALTEKHNRPVLAKIYKTYIAELVAILRGCLSVNEIYIEGDCVWGVFDTPLKSDIDGVFSTAARASSLVDILNIKLKKKKYSEVKVGIGVSYGSSLYIKAGYKGSGINEVVWLGALVGEAAKLCNYGNRNYSDRELMVSKIFYDNLNEKNKSLLVWNAERNCYHGHVVNVAMNEWVENNG